MARAGQEIGGVEAGGRIVFQKTARDTNGELLQYERFMQAGKGLPYAHVHPHQEERFEVLSGTARVRVRDRVRDLAAGETITAPAGEPHTWCNPGAEEARLVIEFRPALRMETFLETLDYVEKAGKLNFFQKAVIAGEYEDVYHRAWPPLFAQRALFGLLAPLGKLLGYKASYPDHGEPKELPEKMGVLMVAAVVAALGVLVFRRRVRSGGR